jgi:CRISPR-associated endonuclease/helicase Cas3
MSLPTFPEFFLAIHGVEPFGWQAALAEVILKTGKWPATLDIPTGCGKTATLDVAVWLLAHTKLGHGRRHPRRVLFVVDRRIVVDSAFERATRIASSLRSATAGPLHEVACALRSASGDAVSTNRDPLRVVRLRGGGIREPDWAIDAAEPILVISTVDQVGSRLLFRGYGLTRERRPVHAGLVGMDSLLLLDEAHLARPFRQTAAALACAQSRDETEPLGVETLQTVTLSATPGDTTGEAATELVQEVWQDARLQDRLATQKRTALIDVKLRGDSRQALHDALIAAYEEHCATLESTGATGAVAIIVNRVDSARAIFDALLARNTPGCVRLLIGPSRPLDKDALTEELLPLIATGRATVLQERVTVISTQCIEAGADFDFDLLLTESAPLDSLRQRFGRLDRVGRHVLSTRIHGVIVHAHTRNADPIYGDSAIASMNWLREKAHDAFVSMGIRALQDALDADGNVDLSHLFAPTADAPIIHPGVRDVMQETSLLIDPDLDPSLYLHGPKGVPQVSLVWRESADPGQLSEFPVSSLEVLSIPLARARRLLESGTREESSGFTDDDGVDDVGLDVERRGGSVAHRVNFILVRNGEVWRSAVRTTIRDIHPDDVLILPAHAGGCDNYGLTGELGADLTADMHVRDHSELAVAVSGPVISLRVSPLRLQQWAAGRIRWAEFCEQIQVDHDAALNTLLMHIPLSSDVAGAAHARTVLAAIVMYARSTVKVLSDCVVVTGTFQVDHDRRPVLVALYALNTGREHAPRALLDSVERRLRTNRDGSIESTRAVSLDRHVADVRACVEQQLRAIGISPALYTPIELAAQLHDEGKRDVRFQAMLRGTPRISVFDQRAPLAKSGRRYSPQDAVRANLPTGWRHEAWSASRAAGHPAFAALSEADQDLVIWLIATHHGRGRSFFANADAAAADGSLAHHEMNTTQAARGVRLVARFGGHGLALLEGILRLADCAASAHPSEEIPA